MYVIWNFDYGKAKEDIKKKDKIILKKLIEQKLGKMIEEKLGGGDDNGFGKYINDSFAAFCKYKKQIIINQRQIEQNTALLKDVLFVSKDSYMINIEFICSLFTECENIIIYDDENQAHFDLSEFLAVCGKFINSTDFGLEKVELRAYRGDNDGDTWLREALGAVNQDTIGLAVTVSKSEELGDETWDIMTINSQNAFIICITQGKAAR